jgi:hypothetical protein
MKPILEGAAMNPILAWCTALIPLLASSLALALNSAPQQVPPPGTTTPPGLTTPLGTTPCDIGPPYTGAIPAAATQAGFTHCAANYDFTYTGSFTDSLGTHQWSNLSSWFSCAGTIGAPYLWFYAYVYNAGNVGCDTSHQNITTDGGVQVLALSYYLTDANAGNYFNVIQSEASGVTSNATNPFPEQSYFEIVMRPTATTSLASGFTEFFDTSAFTSVSGAPCFISNDQEWDQGASATGVGMPLWNTTCGTGSGRGVGVTTNNDGHISTSYGTFGALMTADNVSAFGGCDYWASGAVNGLPKSAFGSCLTNQNGVPGSLSNGVYTVIPPSSSPIFSTRLYRYVSEGPHSVRSWTATSHTTYIQRMTVWECAGWATGPCITNPVITTTP